MSGSTPPSGRPPKQLSSRLMTMKFMQRAAAGSSPTASSPSTPDPSAPSPKRQKTDATSPVPHRPGPSAGTRTPKYPTAPMYLAPGSTEEASARANSSKEADAGDSPATPIDWRREARAAAQAEEMRRQAALERVGTGNSGETKWILRTGGLNRNGETDEAEVQYGSLRVVGFGEADGESEDEAGTWGANEPWRDENTIGGRMRFGKWKAEQSSANDMAPEKQSDSDRDRPAPVEETSSNRRANGGISSGGGITGSGRSMPDDRKKCYRCGQKGHVRGQCTQKQDGRR